MSDELLKEGFNDLEHQQEYEALVECEEQACPFYHEMSGHSSWHGYPMSAEGCELGGDAQECLGNPQNCPMRRYRRP